MKVIIEEIHSSLMILIKGFQRKDVSAENNQMLLLVYSFSFIFIKVYFQIMKNHPKIYSTIVFCCFRREIKVNAL